MISSSTSLSASRRRLQRACPWGGSLQAKAMRRASCLPSSLRSGIVDPSGTLWALVAFEQDAGVGELARRGAVPAAMRCFNSYRSLLFSITGYFFIMGGAYPLCLYAFTSSVTED